MGAGTAGKRRRRMEYLPTQLHLDITNTITLRDTQDQRAGQTVV